MNLTEVDKRGMTPAEIEALAAPGADELAKTASAEADPVAAAPAEASTTPVDAAAPAAEPAEIEPLNIPQYQAADPASFDAAIKDLTEKKNAAFKQLMDGEISSYEYTKAEEAVNEAREQLTIAKTLAAANEQNRAQAETKELQKLMVSAAKAGEIDYKNPKVAARFDAEMAILSNDPDWQNKDFAEKIAEAHKTVLLLHGKAPAASPAPSTQRPPPAVGPRTLSSLPNAAPANTGGDPVMDKFSTLTGLDAENYLASLPRGEVERLMRSTVH